MINESPRLPGQSLRQVILALPAYNEAGAIGDLLDAAGAAFAGLEGHDARVVVVDDGSSDGTADLVRSRNDPFPVDVRVHESNRGLGPAIITSLATALELSRDDNDIIVNMDADNTHPPDCIPSMIRVLDDGRRVC